MIILLDRERLDSGRRWRTGGRLVITKQAKNLHGLPDARFDIRQPMAALLGFTSMVI
jgi:hypothetical protein